METTARMPRSSPDACVHRVLSGIWELITWLYTFATKHYVIEQVGDMYVILWESE